jgi:hypothetical protein
VTLDRQLRFQSVKGVEETSKVSRFSMEREGLFFVFPPAPQRKMRNRPMLLSSFFLLFSLIPFLRRKFQSWHVPYASNRFQKRNF